MEKLVASLEKPALVLVWIFGIWLMWGGIVVSIGTTGNVSGSEFGMLITIASLMAKFAVWSVSLRMHQAAQKAKMATDLLT